MMFMLLSYVIVKMALRLVMFDIILYDGWTCRSRRDVFDYVRDVHLSNSESRHGAKRLRWINYMTDEPKIRMEDMLVN